MEIDELIPLLIGNWSGKLLTYEQPDKLSAEGISTSYIRYRLDRNAFEMEYTHEMGDEEHSALLITSLKSLKTSWIDTYHTGGDIMELSGTVQDGKLIFNGEYDAGNTVWAWKIELYEDDEKLYFKHFNIPPEGEIYLGIDGKFDRSDDEDSFLTDYEY